jgi:hypothetical protein
MPLGASDSGCKKFTLCKLFSLAALGSAKITLLDARQSIKRLTNC